MASSKKWANVISRSASFAYFLVIILQIPLFRNLITYFRFLGCNVDFVNAHHLFDEMLERVPCRKGICTTPLEVTCSQLISTQVFPVVVVKTLLYPAAIVQAFHFNKTPPTFNSLPTLYNFSHLEEASASSDLPRLEVLAGSYLSVGGAITGIIRPGRTSLFGTLMLAWGLVREIIHGQSATFTDIHIYPAMWLAVIISFLSIRRDIRRIVRSLGAHRQLTWLSQKTKHV